MFALVIDSVAKGGQCGADFRVKGLASRSRTGRFGPQLWVGVYRAKLGHQFHQQFILFFGAIARDAV